MTVNSDYKKITEYLLKHTKYLKLDNNPASSYGSNV